MPRLAALLAPKRAAKRARRSAGGAAGAFQKDAKVKVVGGFLEGRIGSIAKKRSMKGATTEASAARKPRTRACWPRVEMKPMTASQPSACHDGVTHTKDAAMPVNGVIIKLK